MAPVLLSLAELATRALLPYAVVLLFAAAVLG